jgi:hypothetical protein
MNTRSAVLALLVVAAAMVSGGPSLTMKISRIRQWRTATESERETILSGHVQSIFAVKRQISPQSSILLFSEVDPALIPYYLHPVKIYQVQTDPETDYQYMELRPCNYPERSPTSFNVDWTLSLLRRDGRLVSTLTKTERQEKQAQ